MELLAVLVILGLLTAVAAVRLHGPYRAARLRDVAERVAFADQQVRVHARRFAQSGQLVCDLDRNLIYARCEGTGDLPHFRVPIPRSVPLDRVQTPWQQIDRGQARIDVAPDGQTPSYAVRLRSADGRLQWLFFSGITGQVTWLEAESDVQQLFQLLDQDRADAD